VCPRWSATPAPDGIRPPRPTPAQSPSRASLGEISERLSPLPRRLQWTTRASTGGDDVDYRSMRQACVRYRVGGGPGAVPTRRLGITARHARSPRPARVSYAARITAALSALRSSAPARPTTLAWIVQTGRLRGPVVALARVDIGQRHGRSSRRRPMLPQIPVSTRRAGRGDGPLERGQSTVSPSPCGGRWPADARGARAGRAGRDPL
jgi:hypothetical protein